MKNPKIIGVFLFTFAIHLLVSCERCPHPKFYAPPELGETYFNVYKAGSYWIYLNQDSSLKDSMYITDYEEYIKEDREINCASYLRRNFNLHFTYFSEDSLLRGEYGFYLLKERLLGGILMDSPTHYRYIGMGIDSLLTANLGDSITLLNSFLINGNVYTKVIEYMQKDRGTVYFAPKIGIIKYISRRGSITSVKIDTFNLHHYFIP